MQCYFLEEERELHGGIDATILSGCLWNCFPEPFCAQSIFFAPEISIKESGGPVDGWEHISWPVPLKPDFLKNVIERNPGICHEPERIMWELTKSLSDPSLG